MTSSMTSQGGLKVGPLYSYMNEIVTFFMITKQRANISSLNFLCICIIRLWLQLYEYIFMTSLMTSPGHKIGQILKLIYLRHYLHYSVDQKLKMSDMLMVIFLIYFSSGMTPVKNFVASSKWRPFWKFLNIKNSFNLTSDMKISSQIMPKKSIFMMMTSSMTSQGGLKVGPLYSFIYEITTFLIITKQRANISSLNFLCICIMRL